MDVDSRESGTPHIRAQRPPLPPVLSPVPTTPVEQALHDWDGDIRRASATHAQRYVRSGASADELAQAARIALWRALDKNPDLPENYIRRLITNSFRSAIRVAGAGVPLVDEMEDRNIPAEPTPDLVEEKERVIAVMDWTTKLPDRDRKLFDLLYVRQMTEREAAKILGLSQPRVSQLRLRLLNRAKSDLHALAA